MDLLSNKRALVVGGSRGIGAAIVARFVDEGAVVRFTYVGAEDAADALARRTGASAVRSDAGDRDALIAAVRESGPLDILVVNAGIIIVGDPLELDSDEIDRMIDVNARAPYHAAVEAARAMPANGRIIVIGSGVGDRISFAGGAAYALTKSAVQGLAHGLARDLGPRGITVNVVQPGPTDTDANPANGPMASHMHDFMAIKRHGTPSEVAAFVTYLAGPEAGWITGACHTIDGGFNA